MNKLQHSNDFLENCLMQNKDAELIDNIVNGLNKKSLFTKKNIPPKISCINMTYQENIRNDSDVIINDNKNDEYFSNDVKIAHNYDFHNLFPCKIISYPISKFNRMEKKNYSRIYLLVSYGNLIRHYISAKFNMQSTIKIDTIELLKFMGCYSKRVFLENLNYLHMKNRLRTFLKLNTISAFDEICGTNSKNISLSLLLSKEKIGTQFLQIKNSYFSNKILILIYKDNFPFSPYFSTSNEFYILKVNKSFTKKKIEENDSSNKNDIKGFFLNDKIYKFENISNFNKKNHESFLYQSEFVSSNKNVNKNFIEQFTKNCQIVNNNYNNFSFQINQDNSDVRLFSDFYNNNKSSNIVEKKKANSIKISLQSFKIVHDEDDLSALENNNFLKFNQNFENLLVKYSQEQMKNFQKFSQHFYYFMIEILKIIQTNNNKLIT